MRIVSVIHGVFKKDPDSLAVAERFEIVYKRRYINTLPFLFPLTVIRLY